MAHTQVQINLRETGRGGEERREREREREMLPDGGRMESALLDGCFSRPFADRLLTIQIRGFEMAESRIWKKLKRPATSLAALAPASQGVPFSGRSLPVE